MIPQKIILWKWVENKWYQETKSEKKSQRKRSNKRDKNTLFPLEGSSHTKTYFKLKSWCVNGPNTTPKTKSRGWTSSNSFLFKVLFLSMRRLGKALSTFLLIDLQKLTAEMAKKFEERCPSLESFLLFFMKSRATKII